VKNKYVILRHLGDMWINHISPRCLKITYTYSRNIQLGIPSYWSLAGTKVLQCSKNVEFNHA
jgi:hypothetical protein